MKNRMIGGMAAILLIMVGSVAWFAADESYVLNIKAHLEPALDVDAHGFWDLGIVFPQEKFSTEITVKLSESFKAETNVTGVAYDIDCKNKTTAPNADAIPLCEWLSVTGSVVGGDPIPDGVLACAKGEKTCRLGPFNLGTSQNFEHLWVIHIDTPNCLDAHQKAPTLNDVDCGTTGVDMESEVNIIRGAISRIADKEPCLKSNEFFDNDCEDPGP